MEPPPAQGGHEHYSPSVSSSYSSLARKDLSELVKKLEVEKSLLKTIIDRQNEDIRIIQENALKAEATIGESNLRLTELIKEKNKALLHIDILKKKLKIESDEKELKIRDLKISLIQVDLQETSLAARQKENDELQVLLNNSVEAKLNEEKKSEKCQAMCEQLDAKLDKTCNMIIQHVKEKQELETLLKESEDEKAQLKYELGESSSQVSDVKVKLSEKEKEMQEVIQLIDKKDSLIKELMELKVEEIKKIKTKSDEMKVKLQNASKDCEKYKTKSENLQQKVEKLEESNNQQQKKYKSQISCLESNVRALEEQKEKIKQEEIKKEKLHKLSENQLENEYSKTVGFLEAANKKLHFYKDKYQEIVKINVNISTKFQDSENNLASMNDTVAKLQAEFSLENQKFQEEMKKLKYQEKLNQDLTNNHENEMKSYLENIKSLQTELKDSMERTRVAEETSMEIKAQISELQKSLSSFSSMKTEHEDLKEKNQITENECMKMKAQISELQKSLDEKSSIISSMQDSKNKTVIVAENKCMEMKAQISELQKSLSSFSSMKIEFEASKERNLVAEEKCLEMKAQISELQNSLSSFSSMETEHEDLKEKNQITENECMKMKAQISELQKSLDEKSSLISSMQDSRNKTVVAEEKYMAMKAQISELQNMKTQLKASKEKTRVAEENCKKMKAQISELQKSLDEKSSIISSMQDSKNKAVIVAENKCMEMKAQISELQKSLSSFSSMKIEFEASKERNLVAEEKCLEMKAQISELQKLLDEKLSLISSMETQLKASKEKTCLAEEKSMKMTAQISEFQKLYSDNKSMISSMKTKLQAAQEENHLAEETCVEMAAQMSEKENSCGKLMEQISELQTLVDKSNQELQKSHEIITNLENAKKEYQTQMTNSLAKQNKLEKELEVFNRSKNMLKENKKSKEMSKVIILENALSNIKRDFTNLEIKLKNKEKLLESNNSFISSLTYKIQQLKEVINQQENIILNLNKPHENQTQNTCQDFLLFNQQREVECKSSADLEDGQCSSTMEIIEINPSTMDIVETSCEFVDTPAEESTRSSYTELKELFYNILASARNDEAKADKYFEQLSTSMVTIANLTAEIDSQKLTLENTQKLLEEQIIEIEKLQKEKEYLEKIIQKQNMEKSAVEHKKSENLSFEEKKKFHAKIHQLEGKLCIAYRQRAALEAQLHEAQSHLSRLETRPQSEHAQDAYNHCLESKSPTKMRGSHDAWQPDPPQEHRPDRISPQLFYGTSTRAPPRQSAWSAAMQQAMCDTCGTWFHSRQELWRHNRTVHGKCPRIESTSH